MTESREGKGACGSPPPGPDDRPLFGAQADADLAILAKALGHPVRVQIVRMLAASDTCMYGDIAESLPLAQSTVSQHLKILKESGLVQGTIEGPRVCYCIAPVVLRRLRLLVSAL